MPTPADRVTVVSPSTARAHSAGALSVRALVLQLATVAALLAVLVALGGSFLSHRIAERQAVHDVAETTDILAQSVVQPSLTEAMAATPAATGALDRLVRTRVLSGSLVRVKIWATDGTILYSDEPRLVGASFGPLDAAAQQALSVPETRAEITDLSAAENALERGQGRLLEVYRPIWTPAGTELLFETYYRYDVVSDRSSELWRGFVGITVSAVALLFVLLVPIVWALLLRARRAQQQREAAIQRSLDASVEERRRIAAALHDGIVQEIAAASFAVAGGAEAAAARGEVALAADLRAAAATVRSGMGGLRSLVVDIYPPTLAAAGLPTALRDMATTLAGRSLQVSVEVDETVAADLPEDVGQAVFRVAQECLRNTVKHAQAQTAFVRLTGDGEHCVLDVGDDGRGFDPSVRAARQLGRSLMADAASSVGAGLWLVSAVGQGTTWRMEVPLG